MKYRHRYTHKSLWDEIRYAVRNTPALRQLGFYSQDYLPSNLFLLSDLLRIIQYSGLRRVRVVNMICRIRNVEFARIFFSFPSLPILYSFVIHEYLSDQKRKIFWKTIARMWYEEIALEKTSILVSVSVKAQFTFLRDYFSCHKLEYAWLFWNHLELKSYNPISHTVIKFYVVLCRYACHGRLHYLTRLFSRPTDISIAD